MDFNWGADNNPTEAFINTYEGYYFYNLGDGSATNFATTSYSEMNLSYNLPFFGTPTPPNYNNITNIITSTIVNETYNINYSYTLENTDSSPRQIECRWLYNSTPINYSNYSRRWNFYLFRKFYFSNGYSRGYIKSTIQVRCR